MKTVIKLEELGMFMLSIYLFNFLDYQWWWFWILILVPDISIVGYAFNDRIGAYAYNVFHHKGIAILLYLIGVYFSSGVIQLTGIILFAHASMDRIFGYGLKHRKGFKFTHLGEIGKSKL
ncbi:MAG: DUF4260 domain-containing protein [Flavobacterium sp.]